MPHSYPVIPPCGKEVFKTVGNALLRGPREGCFWLWRLSNNLLHQNSSNFKVHINQLGVCHNANLDSGGLGGSSGLCFFNKLIGDAHVASSKNRFLRSKILDPSCFFLHSTQTRKDPTVKVLGKEKVKDRFKEKQEMAGALASALGPITISLTLKVEGIITLPSHPKLWNLKYLIDNLKCAMM